MEILLRPGTEQERRRTEEITREAFWNVYEPGCSEHLLLHRLRNSPQYISELDFVALHEEEIVGCIAYARTGIIRPDGKVLSVITFGPVGVLPTYRRRGIGSKLIVHTMEKAAAQGHAAILICGAPAYYGRFGFVASKHYGITDREGCYPAALLARELHPGALRDAAGRYDEGAAYAAASSDNLETFDRTFPPKEKAVTESQRLFRKLAGSFL